MHARRQPLVLGDARQELSQLRALLAADRRTQRRVVLAIGGVGYAVPLGLLVAGICVSSGIARLLPRWLVVFGLVVAVCGELSWISLFVPEALFFIPLTRFPGFVWLILAGFHLPRSPRAAARGLE